MRKIFVLRPGALGDAILTLPALAALRAAFPGARIVFAGNAALGPLLVPRYVDEALAIDDPRLSWLFGGEAIAPGDDPLLVLNAGVIWLRDHHFVAEQIRQRGARVVAAPSQPSARQHVSDYLLQTLAPLLGPATEAPEHPELDMRAGDAAFAAELMPRRDQGPPYAAIHPGSGGRWKCWPAARFAQLARSLQRRGLAPLLIQGPADAEAIAELRAALPEVVCPPGGEGGPHPSPLHAHVERERRLAPGSNTDASGAGQLTIPPDVPAIGDVTVGQLAAVLARCSAVIGNDSGVSHLAAAVGAPTVAIYGPTDPALWGIRGRRVAHVARHTLDEVTVADVLGAVERLL